ncbi:MAG: hypothetical protein MJ252_00295 [archaeon]|nr:hypothetical protein [archaeon]
MVKPAPMRLHYNTITIKDFDPTIPESSFKKVEPFAKTYFSLGLHMFEKYYTITTSDVTTDTVIKLIDPLSPNVVLYVFDDLYAIMRSPHGGVAYEGYIARYDLNGVMEVVHPGDKTKKGSKKFYLIFQNDQLMYDMTWWFFNERDLIPLDDNDAYYFDNMYSLNELSFTFNSFPNETTECIFKSQFSYVEQTTTIYKRHKESSVETWEEMTKSEGQSLNYMVEKSNNGLFKITIKSKNPSTATTARRIISIRQKSWEVFQIGEDSLYKDILVDPRTLYFRVDLDSWAKDEENMLTIYQNPDFEENSVTYWTKIVNCEDKESEIVKLMPKAANESEFFVDKNPDIENYYHIPFKKTKTKVTGQKTFLLITVNFKTDKSFFAPRNLTIAASERVEQLSLSTLVPEFQHLDDTRLKDYIPKITKYTLASNDNNTYLVFVNSPNASTFYYGDLIDSTGHLSENSAHTSFYSFTNGDEGHESPKTTSFYVVYMQEEKVFETLALKTQSKAKILPDKIRSVQDLEVEVTNCDRGFVLTGSYTEKKDTAYAYIEQVYGTFNFYYKGLLNYDDKEQEIMPGEDYKVGYFFDLGEEMDILKITCTYPGKILLHLLDKTSTVQPDERNYFFLPAGEIVTKTLPVGDGVDVELSNHLTANVTGTCNGVLYEISGGLKTRESWYFSKVGTGATIDMVSNIDTVVIFNYIDSQNMYRILDADAKNISERYFLVYLPNSRKDYAELRIDVKRLEHDIYYIFGRCNADNEPEYIPAARFGTKVPLSTLYGKVFHKVIDNPSDKQNSTTFTHFIAFFLGDGTVSSYDVDITYMNKPSYDDLETENIGFLAELPHVAFYESLQIQKKNAKYYTFAAHKCGARSQQLFVKNYYTTYATYQVTNTYHGFTFRNIGNVIQVTGNYASTIPSDITGFEFSYSTSDEPNTQLISDIEQFNSKVILKAYLGSDNRTVTWDETYKERVISYDLYAIDKTIDPNLLTNDCYLVSKQREYAMTGDLPQYFYAIKSYNKTDSLKFVIDYNRNSYIVVVATMTLGLHIRVTFEVLVADIQNEPIPEEWFTYLMPHSETMMSLSKSVDEDYYKFDSQGLNFDNIFRVNEGLYDPEGHIEIYWYPSTASIIVDKDRHFSGYLGMNKLEQGKIDYVLEHSPIAPAVQQTLYVVIKNIGQKNFNSKISLYNENDKFNMGAYETRLISMFFYTQTLTFGFATSLGDVVEFSIKNQDATNTHMIEFYELIDGEYKLLENTTDSEYHKEFKEDDAGYFQVKIKSDKPAYQTVKKLVSFQRTQGELIDLNEGELFEYAPVSTHLFRFKYIMDGFDMNDEGVASVYIPYVYTQSKAFKGIYAKVVSFKADYDDYEKDLVKFSPSTPKESQFDYEPTENFDNYYFLYFKKKFREATGETLFLLLTVDFYIGEDFFDPNTFNAVIGYKADKIDLRKKDYPTNVEVTDSFFVNDFVPRLVTYLLPESLEDTSSFALWFSDPNIAVIYEGALLNQDEINQKKTQYQLFSVSNHPRVSKGKTTQVTLKLFGLSAYAFARRLITPQPIINISGERVDQTRNVTLTNCDYPLTLMGQYSAGIMGWLTAEPLYGQFTFYYKGEFTDGDASAYILPKFTDIIQDEVAKLSSYYDVLTISCTRPGKLFVHIFDELYPINKDGKTRMRLLANTQATLLLPAGNINVLAETSTKDATIKMTYITQTFQFDSSKPYTTTLPNVVASSALFFTSNIDAVISVNTIATPDLFTELKAPSSAEMTKENLVFLLPIDNNTADSSITFEGMKYPLYYSHIQTYGQWIYFPKPEFSGFSHNLIYPDENGKIVISIGNIYDKYEHTNKNYAIGISIKPQVSNDVPTYKVSVVNSEKGQYHALKPDIIGVISRNNDTYFYNQAQIDNSQDPDAYYFVTAHECGSQIQALQTSNYREPLDSYDILHDVSFISFKNYLMDVQLSTNTTASETQVNGLEVSYYIIQNSLDQLYLTDIINKRKKKLEEDKKNDVEYKVHFNRYKGEFTWTDYDQANDYEFYLMRQKTVNRNLANNDCYLLSAEQHFAIERTLPAGFELIQNVPYSSPTVKYKVDDTIAYYAAITARVTPPLPIRMEFKVLSIPIYEPIVPDDHWKVLSPYDPYRLALSLHKTDEFFKFENQNNQTDVTFRVQEGMYLDDTKIDIFFYDEVKKIERDDDGNYVNAVVTFTMKKGQTDYILKHNEFTAKTMYVIVKNYNMTAYSSDIIMWNEKDVKTLVEDNPFVINQFLSTNTYIFNFTTYLEEVVDVVVTNEASNNTHTITLVETTNGTEKIIETSKNSTFRHHFKEDDYGEFRLTVTSEMEAYKSIRKVVQLEKSQGEFDDLLPNIPKTMSLLVSRPFYFKYVLNDYKYNELGIVTLYLTFEIAGLYKGIYGKVVVAEDNETALFPLAPASEADNEFHVENHTDGEHFHLHFKNNKKPEAGKPCILLITVDLEEGYSFFTPREFVVSLSEREEKVDLSDLAYNLETDYSYYVPSDTAKMVTFSYYVGEKQAMIFLSPGETVCTFYNGSYITPDGKYVNEDVNDNLLFAIPNNPSSMNGAYIQTISVKFFGPTARYHLRLVRVKGDVVFREGIRIENSIPFEITNCNEPSYYIESYDEALTAYTYIQLDYGKADFYFRGDYSTHERTSILPTVADKIGSGFRSLGELYSMLKIECKYPVRGELHVFDNVYEDPLMTNARYRFFLGDDFYGHNLPTFRPLYFSAETPFGMDIFAYIDGAGPFIVEKGRPLTYVLDDYQGDNQLSFFSMENTYLEVSIVGDPYQFDEYSEGTHAQKYSKNLVAFVPVDGMKNKLTSYTFKMTNVYQDFIYAFMKTVENDRYFLPLPSKSGYRNQVIKADMLRNHQFTARVGGVFDKVDPDTDAYAFVVEFIDNTTNTTNFTHTIPDTVYPYNLEIKFNKKLEYPIVNKEQLGYLSTVKSDLEYTILELEDPKDREEQYIFFTFWLSGNKLDHVYFMNFENTMLDINPRDVYETYYIKNPKMYLQLEIGFFDKPSKIVPHSGMGFSYYFTNDIDTKFDLFVNELNIKKEKLNVKNNKITWNKITDAYPVDYEIFLFDTGTLDPSELKNEMFVTHARNSSDPILRSYSELKDKTNYQVKEKGKFDAVVIAQIRGPCPIRYIYEYHTVTGTGTSSSVWWIILIIVLAVAAIAAGVIYFIMNKRKRDVVLPTNYDPLMGSINQ